MYMQILSNVNTIFVQVRTLESGQRKGGNRRGGEGCKIIEALGRGIEGGVEHINNKKGRLFQGQDLG